MRLGQLRVIVQRGLRVAGALGELRHAGQRIEARGLALEQSEVGVLGLRQPAARGGPLR